MNSQDAAGSVRKAPPTQTRWHLQRVLSWLRSCKQYLLLGLLDILEPRKPFRE